MTVAGAVRIAPIGAADRLRVAAFLHANLNERVSTEQWAGAIDVPWQADPPNSGFMLLDGPEVVGVQLAFYAERTIDNRRERFCNLGAWCVLPRYRVQGLRLLRAVLSQDGYHFTDLSPSGSVVEINTRLGFRFLDTATRLVPNIPWPTVPGRVVISSDPELIERTLTGRELRLYRDHATTRAARHIVLIRGDESCYVIFRKDRWKRVRAFASVLYVDNPRLYRELARPLARHLLIHHGAVGTLAETRVIGYRPRLGLAIRSPRRKMFLSRDLDPARVDYLYSELACVAW